MSNMVKIPSELFKHVAPKPKDIIGLGRVNKRALPNDIDELAQTILQHRL